MSAKKVVNDVKEDLLEEEKEALTSELSKQEAKETVAKQNEIIAQLSFNEDPEEDNKEEIKQPEKEVNEEIKGVVYISASGDLVTPSGTKI